MGDHLYVDEPSWYVTGCLGQLSLQSLQSLEYQPLAGVKAGCVRLFRVAGNTVWSHMASDTP